MTPEMPTIGTDLCGPEEVADTEAVGAVARAYQLLRTALGVSHVPTVYRMLATHPAFFVEFVDCSLPAVERYMTDDVPARLRAAARSSLPTGKTRINEAERLSDVWELLDRYNRANPLNLLLTLLLAGPDAVLRDDVMRPPLPDPPSGEGVDELLADIRACHGGVTVPGLWREMFGATGSARPIWESVRASAEEGHVVRSRDAVFDAAREAVPEQDHLTWLVEEHSPQDRAGIDRIVGWFPSGISAMIAEIEIMKTVLASSHLRASAELDERRGRRLPSQIDPNRHS